MTKKPSCSQLKKTSTLSFIPQRRTLVMSRPNASAAGLECYEYEWMEEPNLMSRSKISAARLVSFKWEEEPDVVIPRDDLSPQKQAPSDSTWEWKGHTDPTCGICFKQHGPLCPYFDYVPPGATVGPGYSVICHGCCHYIRMPSWICNNCGGKTRAGKVIIKHCIICKSNYQHESADCPHDKDKAAECRWIREVDRSKKYTPWVPNYVPRTPIPQEFW